MSVNMEDRWSDLKPEMSEFDNLNESLEPNGMVDNELSGLDGNYFEFN